MLIQIKKRGISGLIIPAVLIVSEHMYCQWVLRYDNGFTSPSGKGIKTSDGGFIFPYMSTFFKLFSKGSLEWQYKYFGGMYSTDICQTHDGGYVATGFTHGLYGKAMISLC